jgi:hypothetical protein
MNTYTIKSKRRDLEPAPAHDAPKRVKNAYWSRRARWIFDNRAVIAKRGTEILMANPDELAMLAAIAAEFGFDENEVIAYACGIARNFRERYGARRARKVA